MQQKIYQKIFLLLISVLAVSSCRPNTHHSAGAVGKVDVLTYNDDVCILPILDSITMGNHKLDNRFIVKIDTVAIFHNPKNDSVNSQLIWEAVPKSDSVQISRDTKLCLGHTHKDFIYHQKHAMNGGEYAVLIKGVSEDGRYFVSLSRDFYYQPNQAIKYLDSH